MTESPDEPPATPPASPPPPRRRGRLGRRMVKLALLLVVLLLVAPLALRLGAVRDFVAKKASAALGRRVTIGGASASWWGGIDLKDVRVHNPPGYPDAAPPLLAVDRVHVDVAVLKAIFGSIDASVAVEKPVVSLIRGEDGG